MTSEQRLADAFLALAGSTADGSSDLPGPLSVLAQRAPALLGARAATVVFAPEGYGAAHVAGSDPSRSAWNTRPSGGERAPGTTATGPTRGPGPRRLSTAVPPGSGGRTTPHGR